MFTPKAPYCGWYGAFLHFKKLKKLLLSIESRSHLSWVVSIKNFN
mgnify:CR=1 FL=1|jgi:hypothetical protein